MISAAGPRRRRSISPTAARSTRSTSLGNSLNGGTTLTLSNPSGRTPSLSRRLRVPSGSEVGEGRAAGSGAPLAALGIRVAFTPLGIGVALAFVGLPFVVRAVEPVLADLDRDVEEAAATLGATAWQIFRRVILPPLWPALLTGFTLAFGR